MAGDCAYETHYVNDDTFGKKQLFARNQEHEVDGILDTAKSSNKSIKAIVSSPYFEIIDGILYRKKLEKGSIRHREVLDRNRQRNAIAAFHEEPPGKRHHTLDDTYRTVADNYWWEGMYFHIREYVLGCQQCQAQRKREEVPGEHRISRTLASHGNAVLHKLSRQREAGLFCDITLQTGSHSFPAHRAVLAAVSEYFQEIFTEMDSDGQPIIDLTGFREESVLPLLEFSYTSTLSLSVGDLAEVSALAQHFRMWPALEACRAMESERSIGASYGHPRPALTSRAEVSRKKTTPEEGGSVQSGEGHTSTFHPSNGALRVRGRESHTPSSPVCRLKLMDFKSPSSKVKTPSQNPPAGTLWLRTAPQQSPVLACSKKCRQRLSWTEAGAGPAGEEPGEEEVQSPRVLEKYRLLSVLGLQRRSLLPRPEELTGWRQKKRLRKLKVSSYALTAPRKPRAPSHCNTSGLPLSNGPAQASPTPLQALIKTEPPEPISMDDMRLGQGGGWGCGWSTPSGGSERQELRRSVRGRIAPSWSPTPSVAPLASGKSVRVKQEPVAPSICSQLPLTHPRPRGRPRKNPPPSVLAAQRGVQQRPVRPRGRPRLKGAPDPTCPLTLSLLRKVKEEPADALPVTSPVTSPVPAPRPAGRRQRQSKPPLRLLDPGFLFPLSRPRVGVKREEEGLAVWQAGVGPSGMPRTRHARVGGGFDRKQQQPKGPSAPLLRKRKRKVRHALMDSGATGALPWSALLRANKAKQAGDLPKNLTSVPSLRAQRSAALESVRQARLKRLRGRRSHTPVTSHTCLQCKAVYRSCDALIMHRIRHIEGKHWPCPLCSKTFFRQRNVQSHIRTHDPKLYKCPGCISPP